MQTRPLGKADLHLTTIGLGTWAIGGPWDFGWGPQEDTESIAAIQQALDLGINWIDTAPVYGLGHAEEIVVGAETLGGDFHHRWRPAPFPAHGERSGHRLGVAPAGYR